MEKHPLGAQLPGFHLGFFPWGGGGNSETSGPGFHLRGGAQGKLPPQSAQLPPQTTELPPLKCAFGNVKLQGSLIPKSFFLHAKKEGLGMTYYN